MFSKPADADRRTAVTRRIARAAATRAVLGVFAELVQAGPPGTVADLGCGPGRITGHLDGLGLPVYGLDASTEMVRIAREVHPHLRFEHSGMERLAVADGELAAIVAWYSIIHLLPEQLPELFGEFARALAPGGLLQLAFQAADDGVDMQPYDHKVASGDAVVAAAAHRIAGPGGIRADHALDPGGRSGRTDAARISAGPQVRLIRSGRG